ncbi:MAG: transcriptional regulator [Spirochaetaceae bacterium]|nr:transcriptional regulator [Spirochaetaceae bacterium]
MFAPAHFRIESKETMLRVISENSFGNLITCEDGIPNVTHIPFVLDSPWTEHIPNTPELLFHVAGANPQPGVNSALAVFHGPHAYISPSWYEEEGTVPTWNYVAVHARGNLQELTDPDTVRRVLDRTVAEYEAHRPNPYTVDWDNARLDRMLTGIRCYRMTVHELEGKAKLSQNHSAERRDRVIKNLAAGDYMDREVARWMQADRFGDLPGESGASRS